MVRMKPSAWAEQNGVTKWTVWQWIRENRLPEGVTLEVTPTGRYFLLDSREGVSEPDVAVSGPSVCVCYARVSSSDQKEDLQRQTDRLKAFAFNLGYESPKVVSEVASGMNGKRKKLASILSNPRYSPIIVEHFDRLARMNGQLIVDALEAQSRKVIVIDDSEMEDDLVSDVISVMTSFCARLYGRRSARHRAEAALRAAEDASQ